MKPEVSEVSLQGKMCGLAISEASLLNPLWIMSKGHDEDFNMINGIC